VKSTPPAARVASSVAWTSDPDGAGFAQSVAVSAAIATPATMSAARPT